MSLQKIFSLFKPQLSLSSKQKIAFLEQMGNLMNSGIPLTNALSIIMYQSKSADIKTLTKDTLEQIKKGLSLKEIFSLYPKIFTKFDISIIEMGEVTGKLGDSITKIQEKEEKARELKGKILGAMIYPSVILFLATGMIITFMIYVIPKIQKMYKDAKVNLPEITQVVIKISEFLQENGISLGIGLLIISGLVQVFKKHKKTKIYWDQFVLKIPLFGNLIKKQILALFSSNLALLLKSGVMINTALEISASALESDYYEKEIHRVIKGISTGEDLSAMMGIDLLQSGKESPYFPIELSSVVRIGEQTGKLAPLLEKVGIKFTKEIDSLVKNLATAIEPIVIVAVGLIVGTIIMAIMMPFFNMVNVV